MRENAHIRTLRHALALVGGRRQLASVLGVEEGQIVRWLDGEQEVPPAAFFDALDVVSKGAVGAAVVSALGPSHHGV
jgi:hypothetical protein